jgi:hypothetical protein
MIRVCVCVCVFVNPSAFLHDISVLSSFLSSKRVIFGRQEAYLGDAELSMINHAPDLGGVNARGDDTGASPAGLA